MKAGADVFIMSLIILSFTHADAERKQILLLVRGQGHQR